MILSEYWKRLEESFRNKIISAISQNDENYKNISSRLFQYSERFFLDPCLFCNVFCYSLPRYYLIDPNLNRNYLHVLQKEKED